MDKLISNTDLARFNSFLQGYTGQNTYYFVDNLPSLDTIFAENVYYAFLFKKWPGQTVGHWVALIKFEEDHFEYFDCLGEKPPQEVLNLFEQVPGPITLDYTSRSLMAPNNTICGKWCIFRTFCLPAGLGDFIKLFSSWKKTPDSLVDFVVRIPMGLKE